MFDWLLRLFESDPAAAARALREAELSHDQTRKAIADALRAEKAAAGMDKVYCWPRDVYDDRVIYELEGPQGTHLYQRSYSIDEAGQVTLGVDVTEVKAITTYQTVQAAPPAQGPEPTPAREAGDPIQEAGDVLVGDVIPLVEKAMRRDNTIALKVIQPGWGASGYYPADVLERDGPKVFAKGTKMYWDHPTPTEEAERPERSLRDLAGELVSDAKYLKSGPAGPGLYADAKVFGTYKEAVEELAPHIGNSIRALGTAKHGEAEGKSGPIVESLVAGQSIDFVTTPGAGGQVLQLFEAARGRATNPAPQPIQEDTPVGDELSESARQRFEAQEAETARLREALLFREARDVATAAIARYDLPDVTRARLVETLAKNPPVIEETKALDVEAFTTKVTEAVKTEVEYLAKAAGIGDGQVRGMGEATPTDVSEADLDAQLTSAFAGIGLSESAAKIAASGREH